MSIQTGPWFLFQPENMLIGYSCPYFPEVVERMGIQSIHEDRM